MPFLLGSTVFALSTSDVQAVVDSSSKEAVSGNFFIWFLCAMAFLKISQKIDSFMSGLGVNVGHTGGSMMTDALIAAKSFGVMGKGAVSKGFGAGSSKGGSSSDGGFLSGGLAGAVGRKINDSAVNAATNNGGGAIGSKAFDSSLKSGGDFAKSVISNVAKGDIGKTGSITGDVANKALGAYLGVDDGKASSSSMMEKAAAISGETSAGVDSTAIPTDSISSPSSLSDTDGTEASSSMGKTSSPPIGSGESIGSSMEMKADPIKDIETDSPTASPELPNTSENIPEMPDISDAISEMSDMTGDIQEMPAPADSLEAESSDLGSAISDTANMGMVVSQSDSEDSKDHHAVGDSSVGGIGESKETNTSSADTVTGGVATSGHIPSLSGIPFTSSTYSSSVSGGSDNVSSGSGVVNSNSVSGMGNISHSTTVSSPSSSSSSTSADISSTSSSTQQENINSSVNVASSGDSISVASQPTAESSIGGEVQPMFNGGLEANKVPSFSDVEIGGGRITGKEITPEQPKGIEFAMYNASQYMKPESDFQTIKTVDGEKWYKQYAVDKVEKTPVIGDGGKINYNEKIVQKLPSIPRRKDKV